MVEDVLTGERRARIEPFRNAADEILLLEINQASEPMPVLLNQNNPVSIECESQFSPYASLNILKAIFHFFVF